MKNKTYYLVDASALPEVFTKVITAKQLIENKTAASASEAIAMAGVSRSAYYKYKDMVFNCNDNNTNKLYIQAVLKDKAGVFSAFSNFLYKKGANIVSMTQTEPKNGLASVYLTLGIENLNGSIKELIEFAQQIDGIMSIKSV